MRKNALKVDTEYAYWTVDHATYDTATHGRRYGWYQNAWVEHVLRVKLVSTSERRDIPAGKHTSETMSVPVIIFQPLDADGKPEGKPRWTRKSANFISPYDEWVTRHAEAIENRRRHIEQEASDRADATEMALLIANLLGLPEGKVNVNVRRDDNRRTFAAHAGELSLPKMRELHKRTQGARASKAVASKMAASAKKAVKK